MITAYDYDSQRWISGETAKRLLQAQHRKTLALLQSPDGANYARMLGKPRIVLQAQVEQALMDLMAS